MTPVETTPTPPPTTQFGPQKCHLHQLWCGQCGFGWMMMPVTIGGFGLMMMPVTTGGFLMTMPVTTGPFGLIDTPIGPCGLTDTPIGPCMPPCPPRADALEVASAVMPRAAMAARAKVEVRVDMVSPVQGLGFRCEPFALWCKPASRRFTPSI